MSIALLKEAIDQLEAADPFELSGADTVLELLCQQRRLLALSTNVSGSFVAGGQWALSGAKTPGAWLTKETRGPKPEAARLVRRGRQMPDLPEVSEAWLDGAIGPDHFDVLARLSGGRTKEAFVLDGPELLEVAKSKSFSEFCRLASYWEQMVDADGAEEADMERRSRRGVYLVESVAGMYLGQITLDPISGAIVATELCRIERQLFEDDWAKAKAELGREPKVTELARTSAQRYADALVEMATRSASLTEGTEYRGPLFSVLVGYETLHGRISQLANGGRSVLAPGALVPWLDRAQVERAVFTPDNRVQVGRTKRLMAKTQTVVSSQSSVIEFDPAHLERAVFGPPIRVEVAQTQRFFTGATRRAIELRDQVCAHPYCDQAAERCQADHIKEWSKGGLSTQENGRLLCPFHNRQRNQRPPPAD